MVGTFKIAIAERIDIHGEGIFIRVLLQPLPSFGRDSWGATPFPWNINSFGYRDLEGPDHRNYPSYPKEWEQVKMAWMKKNITIPANWTGQQIYILPDTVDMISPHRTSRHNAATDSRIIFE